jgi:subtilisin-like proprotein convertase family protein
MSPSTWHVSVLGVRLGAHRGPVRKSFAFVIASLPHFLSLERTVQWLKTRYLHTIFRHHDSPQDCDLLYFELNSPVGQDTSPDENTQWAVMLNPEVDPSGFAEQFNVALVGSIPALNVHIFIHQPSDKRSLAAEGDSFTSLVDSIMAIQPNDVEAALAQMSQRSTASSSSSSSSSSPPSRLKKMKKRQIVSHDDVLWVQRQTPLKREKRGYLDATAWELGQIRDPLFPAQWHLQQSSSNDHVSIDVIGAWESGATGSGVTIAICDDGLQWTHPDIAQNYRWEGSWNFNKNNNHSGPSDVRSDWHGTSSGSTAAGRDDGVSCGLGSAFRAGLSAVVILQNGIAATDAIEAAALSHAPEVNHIYSNSWGPSDDGRRKEAPGPLTRAAMTRIIKEGRDGLGGIYVWAAGNGATRTDNCNFDGYANMRTTITIGAVDYRGIKSSYSEPCAALFAVAPSSGSNGGNYQYIIAADLLGSDGIDRTDCNRRFTGTSAACPLTAGVIALLLEVNPKLNWIDIQHVIINSTSRNHAEDPDWVQNGAGRWINHKYGFGLINATRAVQIARGFIEHADLQEESASARQASPITFQGSVAQSSLTITDVSFPVRHVEVYLTAIAPTRIGNLKVTLTSPAGTESVLADSHNDATRAYSDWRFTSMRHWGESPAGVWTLRLTDLSMQANTGGELTKWEIVLWGGHSANYYSAFFFCFFPRLVFAVYLLCLCFALVKFFGAGLLGKWNGGSGGGFGVCVVTVVGCCRASLQRAW